MMHVQRVPVQSAPLARSIRTLNAGNYGYEVASRTSITLIELICHGEPLALRDLAVVVAEARGVKFIGSPERGSFGDWWVLSD
jgi:hypothetical protein